VIRRLAPTAAVLALAVVAAGCGGSKTSSSSTSGGEASGQLILASTTDIRDSGLLDRLVPAFQKRSSCAVKPVAVGSGEAIALAAKGQADVVFVHSPKAEETFVEQGHSLSRRLVATNDYALVGPPSDPARAARAGDVVKAFEAIARTHSAFASRADQSGTNAKELEIWMAARVKPSGSWYIKTGQGQGQTLTIASQKRAYTLSDLATLTTTHGLELTALVKGETALDNPYHVIVVRHSGTNVGCARALARYVTSPAGQALIGSFGKKQYGHSLYDPAAKTG
jgi:tungstate transport system substrate-binding protein